MNKSTPWLSRSVVSLVCLMASLNPLARAQLAITVGDIPLNAGQAGQTFDLLVVNSGNSDVSVGGVQLNIQIDVPGGQSQTRPKMTAIDIFTGTVFENDNSGPIGGQVNDFQWEIGTIGNFNPPDPFLPANSPSKVATITFDTTGVSPGNWIVSLSTAAGPTTYLDPTTGEPLDTGINNGTVTVVPEINAGPVVALVLGALAIAWRRNQCRPIS